MYAFEIRCLHLKWILKKNTGSKEHAYKAENKWSVEV